MKEEKEEKGAKSHGVYRGIACPWCGSLKSRVRGTWDYKENMIRRRSRICTGCSRAFLTDESYSPTASCRERNL